MPSAISFTIPLTVEPKTHFIGKNEELAGEKNEKVAIKEGKCKRVVADKTQSPGITH
jgi:hypothetical protein